MLEAAPVNGASSHWYMHILLLSCLENQRGLKPNYTKSSVNDTRVILNRALTKNGGVLLGPSMVLIRASSNPEI